MIQYIREDNDLIKYKFPLFLNKKLNMIFFK